MSVQGTLAEKEAQNLDPKYGSTYEGQRSVLACGQDKLTKGFTEGAQ